MNTNEMDDSAQLFNGLVFEKINPLLEKLVKFLFRKITFDNESLETLKKYSAESVVFASFHTSNLSLLLLYVLLKRYNFNTPKFALEYNPFLLQSVKYIFRRITKPFYVLFSKESKTNRIDADFIEMLLREKDSILVSLLSKRYFLKRYMETKHDSLVFLIDIQKKTEQPIYLFPQIIFWSMNPERANSFLNSETTGNRGFISGWLATKRTATPSYVRIAQPINLKEEIEAAGTDESRHIAIMLRNKLLEIYHYEKRSVLGPVIKTRQAMMEKVLYHKNVLNEIDRLHNEKNISESKLKKKAYKYYKEISANFHISMIIVFSSFLDYIMRKIYDGISYDPESMKMVREASQKGPLIITPCHKSHMDYLIMSHLFFKNKLIPPHIAAGVNLSFFPLGFIFRHSGAFFLRRSFKGLDLYPEVFRQYVKTLVYEGYPIEFFIEGGRSRTGKPVLPKYGFLNYLIDAVHEGYNKDLVFVPISINYDRILEESSYSKELKGKEKEKESFRSVMESRKLLRRKYGKVYISFNTPFTLKEIEAQGVEESKLPEEVSATIIRKINEVTMVTPFSLTSATILLLAIKGFPKALLLERMQVLYDYLTFMNVRMSDSLQRKSNMENIVDTVLNAFLDDKILEKLDLEEPGAEDSEDFFVLKEENRSRITFYKNSIIHYYVPVSFYASVLLLLNGNTDLSLENVKTEFKLIKEMFSHEFIYPEATKEEEQDKILYEYLISESLIERTDTSVTLNEQSIEILSFFSKIIRDYLESYYIVLHTILHQSKSRINKKDLILNIRKNGIKMFHTGDILLAESLSLPNYNNALAMIENSGAMTRHDAGKKNTEMEIKDRRILEDLTEKIKRYLQVIG